MKIGVDIGGSHIAIGLVDEHNEIIEKRTFYTSERKEKSIERYIVDSIVQGTNSILVNNNLTLKEIKLIGIAAPGNPKNGIIKNVINLGIKSFNLEGELRKELGKENNMPIRIENDGKCAALAEKKQGSLKEFDDCVFLCIGTGIGGAAFMGGKFLKPKRNSGFEFGHMVINKNGEKCNCGNKGCFEVCCSKRKFKNELQKILGIKQYIGAKDLIKAIKENEKNEEIKKIIEEYTDNLAIGISNIINILEPEAICIGGSMAHYDELILEKLRNKISSGKYLFNKENSPKIFPAQAGNDAGILGATIDM